MSVKARSVLTRGWCSPSLEKRSVAFQKNYTLMLTQTLSSPGTNWMPVAPPGFKWMTPTFKDFSDFLFDVIREQLILLKVSFQLCKLYKWQRCQMFSCVFYQADQMSTVWVCISICVHVCACTYTYICRCMYFRYRFFPTISPHSSLGYFNSQCVCHWADCLCSNKKEL